MTDYPKSTWRLITSPPARGAWNMALDEAILLFVGCGKMPPTLRFYAWEPPCLSLGQAQPVSDVNLSRLRELGWELVRRPTGGRAILHTDELTYSVCGPEDEPRLAGGVLESYRRLSEALLCGLNRMGIAAVAKSISHSSPSQSIASKGNANPVCFEVPSNYEITVEEKKLLGSAQARRKEGVLQHGSLPLWGDLSRIIKVLNFPDESTQTQAALRLAERAVTAEQVLGAAPTWKHTVEIMQSAFAEILNLEFQVAAPSPEEQVEAQRLMLEKYDHPAWNFRI